MTVIDDVCKLLDHAGGLVGAVGTALAAYAVAVGRGNADRLDRHGRTIKALSGQPPCDQPADGPSADPLDAIRENGIGAPVPPRPKR